MVAYPLQIRWRDSDYPRFLSATATTAEPTASSGPSPPSGVSPKAVKLVVGCTILLVAVILLGIVAILVYRRRRRRQVPESLGQGEASGPGIAVMPDPSLDKFFPSQQTDPRVLSYC